MGSQGQPSIPVEELKVHATSKINSYAVHILTKPTSLQCEEELSPVGINTADSLFIYQEENEDKNQSFRSFLYVLKQTCDEQTKIICNVILRACFIHHRHYLEQTKVFVLGFVFVFVLAHEQAITLTRDNSSGQPVQVRSLKFYG